MPYSILGQLLRQRNKYLAGRVALSRLTFWIWTFAFLGVTEAAELLGNPLNGRFGKGLGVSGGATNNKFGGSGCPWNSGFRDWYREEE